MLYINIVDGNKVTSSSSTNQDSNLARKVEAQNEKINVQQENDDNKYQRSPRVVKISDEVTVIDGDSLIRETVIKSSNLNSQFQNISPRLQGKTATVNQPTFAFNKSELHRKFNQLYPEISPDLRENLKTGKRQIINGCPTYYFH